MVPELHKRAAEAEPEPGRPAGHHRARQRSAERPQPREHRQFAATTSIVWWPTRGPKVADSLDNLNGMLTDARPKVSASLTNVQDLSKQLNAKWRRCWTI